MKATRNQDRTRKIRDGILLSCVFSLFLYDFPAGAQAPADDLTVGGETSGERLQNALGPGGEAPPGAPPGQPGAPGQPPPERLVTGKDGWQEKGFSRIYDAIDGRMIINDVTVKPFQLTRREASRKYDNGTHWDEVPRDGVPSRIMTNSTDYMGLRTAANYNELKGIMFSIGNHPDGSQRFFDQLLVSLDWDGEDISWDPSVRIEPGVYRLTSLERRMYAFIIRDSLDIIRAFQNNEGQDLIEFDDRVDPPTGYGSNTLQQRRGQESNGINSWRNAVASGQKVELEREMLGALAGTEIGDASWFPGGISAFQLSRMGSQVQGTLNSLGIGAAAFGAGLPGAGGVGAYGGGAGAYGGGVGGYGGAYGGGAYGGGAPYGGAYGGGAAAGLNPRGVNIRPPTGGYGGVGQGISPMGGSLGFAF